MTPELVMDIGRQAVEMTLLLAAPLLLAALLIGLVFGTWPAYRIAQGAVRTIEWRMADCARQQRLPGLVHGSKAAIDLITYLGVQANGAEMTAPGLKR